jgi:hypothetical protein
MWLRLCVLRNDAPLVQWPWRAAAKDRKGQPAGR